MHDALDILRLLLSSIVAILVVLGALWRFGQRFMDGEWVEAMKRQRASVREFHREMFAQEFAQVASNADRGRRTHEQLEQHRDDFRQFRSEVRGHLEILVSLPAAVDRMTASLDRFDKVMEALVGKVQNHEVGIATLRERLDRRRDQREG